MKETTEIKETVEVLDTAEKAPEKPYKFRKLSSDDLFLMAPIIKAIGLKELKQSFDMGQLKEPLKAYQKAKTGEDKDKALLSIGLAVGFDAAEIIIGNLPKCKEYVYQLLAGVSGMTEEEIRSDAILFTEMLIDFCKKKEFPAFIKVVSKLFR